MKNGQPIDLGMTGYDELFMTDKQRQENKLPKIHEIPLSQIDDFPDHPFKVRIDEDMEQLVESIKERGLITPIIIRQKEDGRYEIVSGHRRRKACELAGMDSIKAEIREMSRDEAIIMMVESNLQRSVILPSEKALAYKMRLEAIKRLPGRPSKDNSAPVEQNFEGKTSREIIAESSPDSHAQIQRYIRLTELVPEIVERVDSRAIGLRPAVELSYLTKEQQQDLSGVIEYFDSTPSHDQAKRMRKLSEQNRLSLDKIISIMEEEKPNQKQHISIRYEDAKKYIPSYVAYKDTGEYILKALEYYQRYREQERESEREQDEWER